MAETSGRTWRGLGQAAHSGALWDWGIQLGRGGSMQVNQGRTGEGWQSVPHRSCVGCIPTPRGPLHPLPLCEASM